MITIPIWLFIILVVLSSILVVFIVCNIIAYASAYKIEKDYHNRKKDE